MPYALVSPDQPATVAETARILDASRAIDDPTEPATSADQLALTLRYGWDLEPGEHYLYTPEGGGDPVAVLVVTAPRRDNLQLVVGGITVHPDHRRQGHGTALMTELLRHAGERHRSIIWLWSRDGDDAADAFVRRHGFVRSGREARRVQVLADVDPAEVERRWAHAVERSSDYHLERHAGVPSTAELLTELIEVTASINDAPMGDLSFEPEVFDLQRLKDFETAQAGCRTRLYRVIARHRDTGVVGGHTLVGATDFHPERAMQLDTAVHRGHRGHRLGALLKIDMMRWIAVTEPQATEVVTYNNADNDFMISINESLGYGLTGLFVDWERKLSTLDPQHDPTDR